MKTLRRDRYVARDELLNVRDRIRIATLSVAEGGLRVQTREVSPGKYLFLELDEDETYELAELVRKAHDSAGGLAWSRLSRRELSKLERLIEKSCGSRDVFAQVREQFELRTRAAELRKRAARPPRRPRWEEDGAVVLPRELFDWLNRPDPILELTDIALYVLMLFQLENATPLTPGGRLEGMGDDCAVVVDTRLGIGMKFDPDARFAHWQKDLEHLERNGLLALERRGHELLVRRGRRAIAVAKGRQA